MSTTDNTPTTNDSSAKPKKTAFDLRFQAKRGIFSTRNDLVKQPVENKENALGSNPPAKKSFGDILRASVATEQSKELGEPLTNDQPKPNAVEPADGAKEVVKNKVANPPYPKTSDGGGVWASLSMKHQQKVIAKQLRINASAANSLTNLFSALTIYPGSGKEVEHKERIDTLSHLIIESTQLTDALCKHLSPLEDIPDFVRAQLFGLVTKHLATQWKESRAIDASSLERLAQSAFKDSLPGLTQEVVDLLAQANQYPTATNHKVADARIQLTVMRQMWQCLEQVEKIDLRHFDPSLAQSREKQPFSYNRNAHEVAQDLLKIAIVTAKKHATTIDDLDAKTASLQGGINRAGQLACAQYESITKNVLYAAFDNDLVADATLNHINDDLYDQIMDKIAQRTDANYANVERLAMDAFAATKTKQQTTDTSQATYGVAKKQTDEQVTPIISPLKQKGAT